ncbi:MAG: magnesium transporter, partial [Acidobacteriota bacterium]|nr:magnesium transporter [Acidobacteriota bacterium]
MTPSAPKLEDLLTGWTQLSPAQKSEAFRSLDPAQRDDFFLSLGTPDQAQLLLALPEGERRVWMRLLAPDDAADLIQQAPGREREGLLGQLDDHTRTE